MNYNSLTQQIIAYTQRNEQAFINNIPDLINQAMSNIYSRAKTIGFQKTIQGFLESGNPKIEKPLDYKATVNFQININVNGPIVRFLLPRSYEFCVAYWPDSSAHSAPPPDDVPPLFYSADLDVPQNDAATPFIYLAPTPAAAYPYALTYLSFPPIFNAQNSTNFLTDKYPNLLLYGCMVQAIPFLKSDERSALFNSLYEKELENVNKDTNERYTDRTTTRTKD